MTRYNDAKQLLTDSFLTPITELILAADMEVSAAREEVITAQEALDSLRPVWAQGWTDDSMAAQGAANALAELWKLLSVDNQTAAVMKLTALLEKPL